jgi:hypothetical protein
MPAARRFAVRRDPQGRQRLPPWLDVGGFKVRLSFNFGELFASDWIYPASFAVPGSRQPYSDEEPHSHRTAVVADIASLSAIHRHWQHSLGVRAAARIR